MDAVSAGRPETDQDHQDANKNQAIKIEFYLSDGEYSCISHCLLIAPANQGPTDMTDFQEQIGRYRRTHRDGASAMHISSVSSDGYGVRALGPSLSIQTTSSSSRQS